MKELVKLVIVSHKRADMVKSKNAFANACICVEESQREEYEKHNPECEIVCHPDSVVGLSAKYRWCYEHFGELVIIGDDIDHFRRLYLGSGTGIKEKINPQLAYEIIQSTYITAKEMGVSLFAFSKESHTLPYWGMQPFNITGLASGGVIGLIEGFPINHLTDRCVSGLDYFLSGLNAYYNRKLFVDNRFGVACKEGTFVSKGGMSEFRSIETEEGDYRYLKELFGDVIQKKKNARLRKMKHQFEKTMRIPF